MTSISKMEPGTKVRALTEDLVWPELVGVTGTVIQDREGLAGLFGAPEDEFLVGYESVEGYEDDEERPEDGYAHGFFFSDAQEGIQWERIDTNTKEDA